MAPATEDTGDHARHGTPPRPAQGRRSPSLAAVVVSYESRKDLPGCLEALLASEPGPRVIVVDNASADGSAALVRERYGRDVELLALDRNTGFTGGCNRGLAAAGDAEVVAFLNPDVRVDPDCLARAAACLDRTGAGGVAPLLLRPDRRTVDSAGQCLRRWTLEVNDLGYGQPLRPEFLEPRPVLAACGALAVFRREALEAVRLDTGVWDEELFCFWEDLELGWRLWNAGASVWSCPDAVAVHERGAGAARGPGPLRWRRPPELEARIVLNKWRVLARHLHLLDLPPRLPILLGRDKALAVAGAIRRPVVVRHLAALLPGVLRAWRTREPRRRLRLKELPC